MNKLKIIKITDFQNFENYKEIFNGKIKKIFFKLVSFVGKIDGEFLNFIGDVYLEQGFLLDLNNEENKPISFEIQSMSNLSKKHTSSSGLIIIYYNADEKYKQSNSKNVKL